MNRFVARARRQLADERGVALPMALFGLLSISLLVTTVLMTSSSEIAIASAHQDAVATLYEAEGALELYVATKAEAILNGTDELRPVQQDDLVPGFSITVTRLFTGITSRDQNHVQQEAYSIVARRASGQGRRVSAMIRAERSAPRFRLNANAGLTVGGDITITGNSTVSNGSDAACDSAAAPFALQVTENSTIQKDGSSKLVGVADTASFGKDQLVPLLLGGITLDDLIGMSTIRFKAGEFSGRAASYTNGGPRSTTDRYNWGCPRSSDDACVTAPGNQANLDHFPIVAIDAGGGMVTLEGDHGQGVLVVHNGSARISGNFVYQGIVIVQRDLDVKGTGAGVKLEGAVIALGENSVVEDNASGNAVVTYNRCVITDAEEGVSRARARSARQQFPYPLTAWAEVY